MQNCSSGKQLFPTEDLAVEALLDLWSRVDFGSGSAPVTVYPCEDCGQWHFTSKGIRHARLEELIKSGRLDLLRRASDWDRKLR